MAIESNVYYEKKLEAWKKAPKSYRSEMQQALDHIEFEADLPGSEILQQNDIGREIRQLLQK